MRVSNGVYARGATGRSERVEWNSGLGRFAWSCSWHFGTAVPTREGRTDVCWPLPRAPQLLRGRSNSGSGNGGGDRIRRNSRDRTDSASSESGGGSGSSSSSKSVALASVSAAAEVAALSLALRKKARARLLPKSLLAIDGEDRVVELRGFPKAVQFEVGGRSGNVVTSTATKEVLKSWRVV